MVKTKRAYRELKLRMAKLRDRRRFDVAIHSHARRLSQKRRMRKMIQRKCKRTYILVMDIDGTLINYRNHAAITRIRHGHRAIHPTGDPRSLKLRPHFREFFSEVRRHFSLVLFTAGSESHLRYFMKRYCYGQIDIGFSCRWKHGIRKDITPLFYNNRITTFIDDEERHYPHDAKRHLIKISRWNGTEKDDTGLLDVLDQLKAMYPRRFADICQTTESEDEDDDH